jgi:protein-tyrosine phosphatase
MTLKKVLLVCYGNIARSLMAESYLKKMVSERNLKIQVASAGLNALGLPPAKEVLELIGEELTDLSDRKAVQLTKDSLEEADLVLTMEEIHKKAILFYYPHVKDKVFTLKEFAGEKESLDIKDPYGHDIKVYKACYEEIKLAINKSFDRLIKILGVNK